VTLRLRLLFISVEGLDEPTSKERIIEKVTQRDKKIISKRLYLIWRFALEVEQFVREESSLFEAIGYECYVLTKKLFEVSIGNLVPDIKRPYN
jgi:hypothetical protein